MRALTRTATSDAAQALAADGAELVEADPTDLTSLTAAFTGVDRVLATAVIDPAVMSLAEWLPTSGWSASR